MHCSGPLDHEHDAPPGDAATVYAVIDAPPSELGALHETTDDAFAVVPDALIGCPGVVRGATELDATDAPRVPAAFVAVTANV
jgi:hypothetical protein